MSSSGGGVLLSSSSLMTGGLSQPLQLRQQSDISPHSSHLHSQQAQSHHIHRYHPTQPHAHSSSTASSYHHLQASNAPTLLQSLAASDPPSAAASSALSLSSPHRPTSAPPDLELNSTSVFAFPLRNFSHFHHLNGDGEAASTPNGAERLEGGLQSSIRQPLVDDSQSNSIWGTSSAVSSPSSGRHVHPPGHSAYPSHSPHLSLSQQPPSASSTAAFLSRARDADDDLQQLQHSVDSLSLHDSDQSASVLGKTSSMYGGVAGGSQLSDGGASASNDVSSSYLYNLNLQQSLLSSLNLSALSPGQLALLQQQMQRLSSPALGVDEQQKQLQSFQQQQQLLLLQQQQLQQMQGAGYPRMGYTSPPVHRGYRNGGPPEDRMRGGQGGDRYHHGRRGRDDRGHGQFQQRSNAKYSTYGNGKGSQGGGYRGQDSRGVGYGAMYGQYDMNGNGEGKLHRPLSPVQGSQYPHSASDPSDDSYTSSVVNQFTSSSTLEELTGHIYLIAKDQYGCRLLQRMLDDAQPPGLCDAVFAECYEHINELMTDAFGNYLMQKLIEHCSEEQRVAIIQKAANDLVAIALNMHGTRAVQKIVETVTSAKEVEVVVAALRSSVVTLIKDLNGNHVIQRCLHHLSSQDNQFIYDAVSRHCVSVSTHKHGCCVLQRCLDYSAAHQKRQIVQEVVNNALELVQDAFGNYVVQYVLDLGEAQVSAGIISNLLGHISALSVQKFSSNVVEKGLELASDKLRSRMIDELMNAERLPRLLQDPTYVLQKALTVCKRQQFERLVTAIKPHLLTLKNTSFGKRIQSKIVRKFPHLALQMDEEGNGQGMQGQGMQGGQHYGQQQGMMQAGQGGRGGLRYGNVSPNSALQQSLMQQQLALQQQLGHQQAGLGPSNGGLGYNGLQGLSSASLNDLGDLGHSSSHSLHGGPPGLPQPVGTGNGVGAGQHSMLNGMPQLLPYPPSTLHPNGGGHLLKQNRSGLAVSPPDAYARHLV